MFTATPWFSPLCHTPSAATLLTSYRTRMTLNHIWNLIDLPTPPSGVMYFPSLVLQPPSVLSAPPLPTWTWNHPKSFTKDRGQEEAKWSFWVSFDNVWWRSCSQKLWNENFEYHLTYIKNNVSMWWIIHVTEALNCHISVLVNRLSSSYLEALFGSTKVR